MTTRAEIPQGPPWLEALDTCYADAPLWLLKATAREYAPFIDTTHITPMAIEKRKWLKEKNELLNTDWLTLSEYQIGLNRDLVMSLYAHWTGIELGDFDSASKFMLWLTSDLKEFYYECHEILRCECSEIRFARRRVGPRELEASSEGVKYGCHGTQLESNTCTASHILALTFTIRPSQQECKTCRTNICRQRAFCSAAPRYLMITCIWQQYARADTIIKARHFQKSDRGRTQIRIITYCIVGLIRQAGDQFDAFRILRGEDGGIFGCAHYEGMAASVEFISLDVMLQMLRQHGVVVMLEKISDITEDWEAYQLTASLEDAFSADRFMELPKVTTPGACKKD